MKNTNTDTDPDINSGRRSRATLPHEGRKGRNRKAKVGALAGLVAAGAAGATFALSSQSHNAATDPGSRPTHARELTRAEAASQYDKVVAGALHRSASTIIGAYNENPKGFSLTKGTGKDSGYELLRKTDGEQSVAAVLVSAKDGATPQVKDAVYASWDAAGGSYSITEGVEASNAALDLGAKTPTEFTLPAVNATEVPRGPQVAADTGGSFASTVDRQPSVDQLQDASLAAQYMATHPPFER